MNFSLGIIIPVYNVRAYLEECLDSVLNQKEPFDEIIIIDDGSNDGSSDVCRRYSEINPSIELIRQENKGLAATRNVGLSLIHSRYVCFLDADDYISENYVTEIKKQLQKKTYNMICFEADIIDEIGNIKRNVYDRSRFAPKESVSGKELLADYYRCFTESACMAVYDKRYLIDKKIEFTNVRMFEDNLFTLRAINEAKTVLYLGEKIYIRRYRNNSITTSEFSYKKWKYLLEVKKECFSYIEDNVSGRPSNYLDSMLFYMASGIKAIHWRKKMLDNKKNLVNQDFADIQRRAADTIRKILEEFNLDHLSFDTSRIIIAVLFAFDEMENCLADAFYRKGGLITRAWEIYSRYVKDILIELPLKENKRVGIYGTGDHTRRMLKWYELFFDINCKLVFIDSYIESGKQRYLGLPIVNVNDVSEYNLDDVIISSVLYEDEMCKALEKNYHGNVHRFYERNKDDIFVPMADKPLKLYIKYIFKKGEVLNDE